MASIWANCLPAMLHHHPTNLMSGIIIYSYIHTVSSFIPLLLHVVLLLKVLKYKLKHLTLTLLTITI